MFIFGDVYVNHIYKHLCVRQTWTYLYIFSLYILSFIRIFVVWATQRLLLGRVWPAARQLSRPGIEGRF